MCVWQDKPAGGNNGSEIYFRASLNKGVSFRNTKILSNNSGVQSLHRWHGALNGTYVVWQDKPLVVTMGVRSTLEHPLTRG